MMRRMQTALGTFEVSLQPQAPHTANDEADGVTLARMSLEKRFSGQLDATSEGQMLSARTAIAGSAGYVAIERVTGTLDGKRGSFVLQHHGVMDRGVPSLAVTVVPDSGTGELAGLAGRMTIEITQGQHKYSFGYELEHRMA